MDDTAIQATPNPSKPTANGETGIQATSSPPAPAAEVSAVAERSLVKTPRGPLSQILHALASLRITVVFLSLSILLVFFGTLAQMDQGIHAVLHNYFRCLFVWIPFQLFVRFGQIFLGVPHTA